jgi:anti-sigma factor RsiW
LFALLPAFALGATDPDEAAFVRRHLTDAPGAEAELAAYARLVDVLHFSAPQATPPPALEARLRAALMAPRHRTSGAASPTGRGRSWHWPRLQPSPQQRLCGVCWR